MSQSTAQVNLTYEWSINLKHTSSDCELKSRYRPPYSIPSIAKKQILKFISSKLEHRLLEGPAWLCVGVPPRAYTERHLHVAAMEWDQEAVSEICGASGRICVCAFWASFKWLFQELQFLVFLSTFFNPWRLTFLLQHVVFVTLLVILLL